MTSKALFITGYIAAITILAAIASLWTVNSLENQTIIHNTVQKQTQNKNLLTLHYVISQRKIFLSEIQNTVNIFKQQSIYEQYKSLDKFITGLEFKSTDDINATPNQALMLSIAQYRSEIQKITEDTNNQLSNANDKLSLTFDNFVKQAKQVDIKYSDKLTGALTPDTLDNTNTVIENNVKQIDNNQSNPYGFILFLSVIGLALGAFTLFVSRKTEKTEATLKAQGDHIRELYEITTRSDLTLDEQIDETLRLGRRLLGTEIGKVGRQDPEKNESHFLNTVAPPDLPAKRGIVLPLDKTFCNITFIAEGPIAIEDVANSDYKNHPAATFLGMQTYIGTTIKVHGKKFGTVNFSNRQPRKKPFTETEKDLVNLIGSWISVTMEKQITEEELKDSKIAAEEANKAKSKFLANMSHEIRTPLTAILGYSDMLQMKDQSREETQHEIESIIKSGAHLQTIINDILDLSKIEAAQLVMENIDVSPIEILQDLDIIMGKRAREKGLDFTIDYQYPFPKKITTDPTRLKQVLFNICGNAIKFTQKGSISIKMVYMHNEKQIKFSVEDTGIGLSSEEIKRLFKPFSQADSSTTRKYGGSGLGLCISQQLSNSLGGQITITSEKGHGSTFDITISTGDLGDEKGIEWITEPVIIEHVDNQAANNHIPTSLSGHILLAEDNSNIRKLVTLYLTKAGATVDAVENGLMALQQSTKNKYDLVLMDMQMPVMDGLTAISKLRETGYDRPIVMLTANAMKEDKDTCLEAGANDYLTKPIVREDFYKTVKKYLNSNNDSIEIAS